MLTAGCAIYVSLNTSFISPCVKYRGRISFYIPYGLNVYHMKEYLLSELNVRWCPLVYNSFLSPSFEDQKF